MKKKKWIIICILLCIVSIALYDINNAQKENQYELKYGEAFIDLFVTERNEVFRLYEAIGYVIESPNSESYENAFMVACVTEKACKENYGKMTNLTIETFGAGLVYYATFYRDIKDFLSVKAGVTELQCIYDLLGKIIILYDNHSNPVKASDKIEAMLRFYKSLSLLNEEMQLCNRILQ